MSKVSDKEVNKDLTLLNMSWKKVEEPKLEELSEREMEAVTRVFRSFETGLREATIYPKDLLPAMKMLGLNPMEQEIVDLTNEIARNGFIYFPEFQRWKKGWKLGRNFPESIMVGRKFSAMERCFDII